MIRYDNIKIDINMFIDTFVKQLVNICMWYSDRTSTERLEHQLRIRSETTCFETETEPRSEADSASLLLSLLISPRISYFLLMFERLYTDILSSFFALIQIECSHVSSFMFRIRYEMKKKKIH